LKKKLSTIFEHLERIIEFSDKILRHEARKIPDITELYPLGLRLNVRIRDGESYYLVISPKRSFVKKGSNAVDLNLEAPKSFWIGALEGKYSIISGLMNGQVKVRGLRSSFLPLIIFSSIISLFSKSIR
jgi:putative sterol carrier protein